MTARRPSRLEASIAGYRDRLLALDAAALASLEEAYAPGRDTIMETIGQLVTQIEQADGQMTPSQAARLSRATELLRLIETETARLATQAGQTIPAAQTAAVSQAIERAEQLTLAQAPDQQAAANIAREWTALNRGAMEALVGQLADGSPVNDWLQQVVGETVDAARATLMDGITRGLSPRQVGASLANVSGMPLRRAQMAARTAMMDSYRSASLQTYAANDDILAGWTWSAAHQTRTCLACLAKDDGTVYPLSVQFMASHVACRCSPLPALLDDDLPPIETGVEWFNKQPQAVRDKMLPVGLRDEFRAGKVRIEDMATLQRDERFGDRWRQSTISEARANAKARRSGTRRKPTPATPPAQTPQVAPQPQIPAVPPYKPATTLKEAEAYAKSLGIENAVYREPRKRLDAEQTQAALNAANAMNEAAAILIGKGVPVPNKLIVAREPRDAYAFWNRRDNSITANTVKRFWRNPEREMREIEQTNWFATRNPADFLIHEVGHSAHAIRIGNEAMSTRARQKLTAEQEAVAHTVSRYAATDQAEYVAEVFTLLVRERPVSAEVMDLYREFGGYEP